MILDRPTAANMTTMRFTLPPEEFCVSEFKDFRNRLKPPFRITIRGQVLDLQPIQRSYTGNEKRSFNIMDASGYFIACCALFHNTENTELQNQRHVVLYFGTGRPSRGNGKGVLYLGAESFILPSNCQSMVSVDKFEELKIV